MSDLRFPIGKFTFPGPVTSQQRSEFIQDIAQTPARLREAVSGLSESQLDTPYRPDGWTVRQVVHHVPDSHVNSFIRFKLALTEDNPTIKPYLEDRWAKLADAKLAPAVSLDMLDCVHERWIALLGSLGETDWARTFVHPERGTSQRLDETLALYSWHGKHHVAHITSLRERMGW